MADAVTLTEPMPTVLTGSGHAEPTPTIAIVTPAETPIVTPTPLTTPPVVVAATPTPTSLMPPPHETPTPPIVTPIVTTTPKL